MLGNGTNQRLAELRARLSQPPEQWTGSDVIEWLKFIGLEQYASSFQNLKIDGYLILELTEEDLEGELQVNSRLHRKKILKAIDELKEFAKEPPNIQRQKTAFNIPAENDSTNAHLRARVPDAPPVSPVVVDQPTKAEETPFINVVPLEGPTVAEFKVGIDPVNIGRHSSNQIAIFDESVSRHHAQIEYDDGRFFLKDIGSTTGTFIKIQDPLALKKGMILEVGSYQFQVTDIVINQNSEEGEEEDDSRIILSIHDSPEEQYEKMTAYHGSSIGRKSNNSLPFPDDLHMSNIHAKINLINETFYFEDMASTNGSWLRLSAEGTVSVPYPLDKNVIFKIGNTAMYEVRIPIKKSDAETINSGQDRTNSNDRCSICWESDRDCLIMPCRHNVSCMKCIKSVKLCPLCRSFIKDIIKIYK